MNEYIQVLKNGINNISGVAEGWSNLIKDKLGVLSPREKEVVEKRIIKCSECPFNSSNAKKNLGYETDLGYDHCSSCKCPLDVKPFALHDNCGLEWFMFNAQDESVKHIKDYYTIHNESIELKWKAIN